MKTTKKKFEVIELTGTGFFKNEKLNFYGSLKQATEFAVANGFCGVSVKKKV